MIEKRCTRCGKVKPQSEFYKCTRNKNGLQSRCKACDVEMAVKWQQSNKERAKKNQQRASWRRLYGISESEYNEMLVAQNFRCAMCGIHQSKLNKSLSVDHNHATGEVRGLLCSDCNFILGHAKDDPGALQAGITYLRRTTCGH